MDTITGGPAGFPLFVYLIREWLLLYDSPRNLTILPWCTMRSMTAAAMSPSPNTSLHRPNSRFVVNTTLRFPQESATTWNRSLAPSMSMGR